MVLDSEVTEKIIQMSSQKIYAIQKNIYRETLRELLNIFGGIFYIDGNNNKIKVHCVNGKQERSSGSSNLDNTLILPYITITEMGTENADQRRRYNPVLVHEKIWDEKERRAKRYLSLSPRPIDISYQINIWTKYQADMDILRYSIFSLFNPDLDIKTRFSDFTKAFIESESDVGNTEADDTSDRLIKKSIYIKVETYMSAPKFLYTNTGGELLQFFDVGLESIIYEE